MKIQYLFVQQVMKDGPENGSFSSFSEKGWCFMQLLVIDDGSSRLGKMRSVGLGLFSTCSRESRAVPGSGLCGAPDDFFLLEKMGFCRS